MKAPRLAAFALAVLLAACAETPRQPPPLVPADFYTQFDRGGIALMSFDESALYDAGIVLGNNGPRPIDPRRAAHAIVSVEYLAWAMNNAPYWIGVETRAAWEITQARLELRGVIGAAPNAERQDIIDALIRATKAPDDKTMAQALNSPAFPEGGAATLERIKHIGSLPVTERAIPQAARARYWLNTPPELVYF